MSIRQNLAIQRVLTQLQSARMVSVSCIVQAFNFCKSSIHVSMQKQISSDNLRLSPSEITDSKQVAQLYADLLCKLSPALLGCDCSPCNGMQCRVRPDC